MKSDKIKWQPKIVEPKFLIGQIVFFVRENQIKDGHISQMRVIWREDLEPLIEYKIFENDNWFINKKVFHSIDSLVNSLKEEFENNQTF